MDKTFHRMDDGQSLGKEEPQLKDKLLEWTTNIVAAYLSKNEIDPRQLPQVLETVYGKLSSLGQSPVRQFHSGALDPILSRGMAAAPAILVDKSITPDFIVCLEDGVRLKTLKRYLFRKYQLTPEQYRLKWGLPPNYPMVAPNYAAKRSALARKMGLGRQKKISGRRRR